MKPKTLSRRAFLKLSGSASLGFVLSACGLTPKPKLLNAFEPATYANLPRWRGFNLLDKFRNDVASWNQPYNEWDLDFVAAQGFNFVRLPTDYHIWTTSPGNYLEQPLKEIDQLIEWARARGIHVNVCLHRAPGYCVNKPAESLDLWADGSGGDEARQQFAQQWRMLAIRYRGVPAAELSFNLVNEPPDISGKIYARSAALAVAAIREADPDRLIIADGAGAGTKPVSDLVSLKIAQSTRGYAPMLVTHYHASWVDGADKWPVPTWPILGQYNREILRSNYVEPWKIFSSKYGVGIHVGEWGAHNQTPHNVVLAWMKDCLENWQQANMGWALWNLRGSFGVLDSGRSDIIYENFQGHSLDRAMLEALKMDRK